MGEDKAEGGRIHQNFDRTDMKGSFIERRKERERLVRLETHGCVALCVRNVEMGNQRGKKRKQRRRFALEREHFDVR